MDRLEGMRVFIAVVDAQGISAASRTLSMPVPTVSRKVAELEQYLGAQLLIRSTRKVAVTDSGQRYYEDARRILDEIGDAERQVSGEYRSPKGRLKVTAPTLFGQLHVLPIVTEFMETHREISAQLTFTKNVVDLAEEHIDLGIRIASRLDDSLIAREVGSVRQIVCGSPSYFQQYERPMSPRDLSKQHCVTFPSAGTPAHWQFRMPSGKIRDFPVHSRLTVNSIEGNVQAALQGAGLVQLYSYQAAPHIAEGTLELVLEEYEINPTPVNFVYPRGIRSPLKIRAFIDFAVPRLSERLAIVGIQCSSLQN